MRTRSLACLAILLSCSGCAVGAVGIAADVLTGASLASLTVTGKGLADHAMSAASGKDCRLAEGMLRSDRTVCEDYKLAASPRQVLIKTNPPPMPDPVGAQLLPAVALVELPRAQPLAQANAAAAETLAQEAPARPIPAAAQEDLSAAQSPRPAHAPSPAEAAASGAAATPGAAEENPAVVMEAEDSLKLNFGGGRSDQTVLAQLNAAIATWRQTVDQPAPAPAEQPPQTDQPARP